MFPGTARPLAVLLWMFLVFCKTTFLRNDWHVKSCTCSMYTPRRIWRKVHTYETVPTIRPYTYPSPCQGPKQNSGNQLQLSGNINHVLLTGIVLFSLEKARSNLAESCTSQDLGVYLAWNAVHSPCLRSACHHGKSNNLAAPTLCNPYSYCL